MRPTGSDKSTDATQVEHWTAAVTSLLARLATLEPFWAYPGPPQFARLQRSFTAGDYDRFARSAAAINQALTTDSYRSGTLDRAEIDEDDLFTADSRQAEPPLVPTEDRCTSRCSSWTTR